MQGKKKRIPDADGQYCTAKKTILQYSIGGQHIPMLQLVYLCSQNLDKELWERAIRIPVLLYNVTGSIPIQPGQGVDIILLPGNREMTHVSFINER
jgi:hypothetical protein